MRTAVPPALHTAAQQLTDKLVAHVHDDPELWRDLWQPPIPDALSATPPSVGSADELDGEYTVAHGHAHWCADKGQSPVVWLTLAVRPSNGEVALLAEALDGRGRVVTVPTRPAESVSGWVKSIPRPGE